MLAPWKKSYHKPRQCIKKKGHKFANKDPYSQRYGFPVAMYEYKSWTIKKAECWRTDAFKLVLENTLESSLDCKVIKPVNPKGNKSWIFTGRIDAKAEALILRSPDAKSQLTGKDPDAGNDWKQEKGMIEDMVGWYHQLNGYKFEQTGRWWRTG